MEYQTITLAAGQWRQHHGAAAADHLAALEAGEKLSFAPLSFVLSAQEPAFLTPPARHYDQQAYPLALLERLTWRSLH